MHAPCFLTYADAKYIVIEKQISISTLKYRFQNQSEKFVNFRSSH